MPNYKEKMTNLVAGDYRGYQRTVTGIPSGETLSKAYFTVKAVETDADPGIFQKVITATNDPSHGQITDTGADGTGVVFFRLLRTDTALLTPDQTYYYDVQLHFSSGFDPITVVKGTVTPLQGVTAATA